MTSPTAWPGYQPKTFVGYPEPVAGEAEQRDGPKLDAAYFTGLDRTVAGLLPRLKRIGLATPGEGQVAQVDASSGAVTMPSPANLPEGAVLGWEKTDTSANTVTVTVGGVSHVLRLRGQMILLLSRGAGVWDRLANWLPYDAMKAVLDALYATKAELTAATTPSTGTGGSTGGTTGGSTGGTTTSGSAAPAAAGARTGFYDPTRTLYLPPSGAAAMRALRGHVSRAAAGELVNIVAAGDSRTAGHGVGSQLSWASQIRGYLTALGIPIAGTGLVQTANGVGADTRITQSGSSWSQIPPYRQWAATGQVCTFTSDSPGTVAEVYYYDNSGTFTVSIDGGTAVTVTPGGTAAIKKYTRSGLTDGNHTITVTSSSAAGYLIGFCVRRASGLLINPVAISGTSTTDLAATGFTNLQTIIDFIAPSILCVMNGAANGLADKNISVATTASDLTKILSTNNPTPAKWFMVESAPPNLTPAQWAPYVAAMYDQADTLGFPILDFNDRWGTPDQGLAAAVLLSDKLHETAAGYSSIARSAAALLAA